MLMWIVRRRAVAIAMLGVVEVGHILIGHVLVLLMVLVRVLMSVRMLVCLLMLVMTHVHCHAVHPAHSHTLHRLSRHLHGDRSGRLQGGDRHRAVPNTLLRSGLWRIEHSDQLSRIVDVGSRFFLY